MPTEPSFRLALSTAAVTVSVLMAGCTVGQSYVKPEVKPPAAWDQLHGGDDSLRLTRSSNGPLVERWWEAFGDPLLNDLEAEALRASPDLRTAALNLAAARLQRTDAGTQGGLTANLTAGITRQRQSENGAGTRLIDVIGGDRDRLASLLAQPFPLYQAGIDVSWEPDLWGQVRRAVESADASVADQAALLDLTRLSLTSELARRYQELRSAQRQIQLLREDVAALQQRLSLLAARVDAGTIDHFDLERQRAELAAIDAQLPPLLAQQSSSSNQLTLLLGKQPGELNQRLASPALPLAALPDLSLGIPSELAGRRPDLRSAEAKLRAATANVGVAQAALYPSIRLGARAGLESFRSGEFSDWGSRTWSIGPSLDLPLFDQGRRQRVVQLREIEQQKAAINFQRTVLSAWQEIDDGLSAYMAAQRKAAAVHSRISSSAAVYQLAQARFHAGTIDYLGVIDAQRAWLQARRDLITTEEQLASGYIMINKAIGNVGPTRETH